MYLLNLSESPQYQKEYLNWQLNAILDPICPCCFMANSNRSVTPLSDETSVFIKSLKPESIFIDVIIRTKRKIITNYNLMT